MVEITQTTITIDDVVTEAELYDLMSKIGDLEEQILKTVPAALLFVDAGQPNVRNKWGAILHHIRMTRATLKAFM